LLVDNNGTVSAVEVEQCAKKCLLLTSRRVKVMNSVNGIFIGCLHVITLININPFVYSECLQNTTGCHTAKYGCKNCANINDLGLARMRTTIFVSDNTE